LQTFGSTLTTESKLHSWQSSQLNSAHCAQEQRIMESKNAVQVIGEVQSKAERKARTLPKGWGNKLVERMNLFIAAAGKALSDKPVGTSTCYVATTGEHTLPEQSAKSLLRVARSLAKRGNVTEIRFEVAQMPGQREDGSSLYALRAIRQGSRGGKWMVPEVF